MVAVLELVTLAMDIVDFVKGDEDDFDEIDE